MRAADALAGSTAARATRLLILPPGMRCDNADLQLHWPTVTPFTTMRRLATTLLSTVALLVLLALVAGCASAPIRSAQPPSSWRVAAADTPLGRLPTLHQLASGRSAFRPLLQPLAALQTRLALIQQAQVGIDLQTYQLGNDVSGREVLRALADASDRSVRVRLLIDDFHALGLDELLLGLAAHPGAEVRMYNPFTGGRNSTLRRVLSLAGDFSQLNRRMHNKLLVADGRVAIVGGRNLTDAYYMRSGQANFLDIELLGIGQVASDLGNAFDHYWNSSYAVPVQALGGGQGSASQRRAAFEALTHPDPLLQSGPWLAGVADAVTQLAALPLSVADAKVYFDNTAKTGGGVGSPGGGPPLPIGRLVREARRQLVVVSPYFLPSDVGLKLLRDARKRGVDVQVLTNSLVETDEPLVSLAYGRHRHAFLQAGLRLFEMSSDEFKRAQGVRALLGASVARLHAKLGLIDQHLLLIGSLNIDPRSAHTNTELALVIDSADLVGAVQQQFQPTLVRLAYEVRLAADGQTLVWVSFDEKGVEQQRPEPTPPPWRLLLLWLMARFVPDDLL